MCTEPSFETAQRKHIATKEKPTSKNKINNPSLITSVFILNYFNRLGSDLVVRKLQARNMT
jgi:hypothetical protein